MNLTLAPEEVELIARLLRGDLGDMKFEISNTEKYSWRVEMKRDEELLKGVIERLERTQAAA